MRRAFCRLFVLPILFPLAVNRIKVMPPGKGSRDYSNVMNRQEKVRKKFADSSGYNLLGGRKEEHVPALHTGRMLSSPVRREQEHDLPFLREVPSSQSTFL
jgi:hypothetical protein